MSRPYRILILALGALVAGASFAGDDFVIKWVAEHQSRTLSEIASFFTKWGDFPPIVVVVLLAMLVAWRLKRGFAVRVLVLMLVSAISSGLIVNILRVLTGRARPSAKVPSGWYGMRDHGVWIAGKFGYSSFPSAHTAVAIGCVVPLWLMLSGRNRVLIALPATLIALCVAASRILLNAHHLSDVLVSTWLGAVIGTMICGRWGKTG